MDLFNELLKGVTEASLREEFERELADAKTRVRVAVIDKKKAAVVNAYVDLYKELGGSVTEDMIKEFARIVEANAREMTQETKKVPVSRNAVLMDWLDKNIR